MLVSDEPTVEDIGLEHLSNNDIAEDENEDVITKAEQELEEIRTQEELLKELLRSYQ